MDQVISIMMVIIVIGLRLINALYDVGFGSRPCKNAFPLRQAARNRATAISTASADAEPHAARRESTLRESSPSSCPRLSRASTTFFPHGEASNSGKAMPTLWILAA